MFKATTDFKIGQLNTLENQLFEIMEENQQLNFHIEVKNNKNIYPLNFISSISFKEILKFNLNEYIMRYLPSSFIIIISFKDRDNLVGCIELSFSIESCK